jgi:hypothetical protein
MQIALVKMMAVLRDYGIEKNQKMSFLVTFKSILPITAWAPFYNMNLLDI